MQNFMRKHKKAILFFIILFIGVPFVFAFGMPSCRGMKQNTVQDEVIASVGGVPVTASEFEGMLDLVAQRKARNQERPTFKELAESGDAQDVLKQMVDSAYITLQEQVRAFDVGNGAVDQQMQKWPRFQDEDGNFDADLWNSWVSEGTKVDWNAIRGSIKKQISRKVYLDAVLAASARLLDSQLDKELEDNYTKIKVKYLQVDPKYAPSDEEIQRHYDENSIDFKTPDEWLVDYVAISLQPEMPPLAHDIIKQAREGADFAKLADTYSELKVPGGEMKWQKAREDEPEHRKPLFALAKGEVSEPVRMHNNLFIYKVEDERTDEETGEREVHARQIMLKADLTEEERAKREEDAEEIAEKAKELGSLEALAAQGLSVQRTGKFNKTSTEIENVDRMDVGAFRTGFDDWTEDARFKVLTGRSNLYVADVAEKTDGVIPPIEEVREKVVEDTIAAHKKTDEYKARVRDYVAKIEEQATSLDRIAELFPELEAEIKETDPFKRKDYYVRHEQTYLQAAAIYDAVGHGEPGAMGGPVTGFMGQTYFVELVERTPPTEEDKAGWDEERKSLRDSALQFAEREFLEDFAADLRERMAQQVPLSINHQLIAEILGQDQEETPAEDDSGDSGGDDSPAADGATGAATATERS